MYKRQNLFPDSKSAKGKKKQLEAGKDGSPAAGDEEMSTEAVAMAYLLKGVHF